MISDINNKILNNLKESVDDNRLDVNKIAKFLEKAVVDLTTTDYTCSWYDLDKDLAIFVGWTEGYDPEDDTVIHSKNEPSFVLASKIASTHEYMKTDLDWLTQPYDKESGDVWDTEMAISPNEDYVSTAKWYIEEYKKIRKALDNGELLLESKKAIKEESSNNSDLERLANDILDWYDRDMGTHFDEISGNEEEIFNELMGILENKDRDTIQIFINDIESEDNDDEEISILNRLKPLISESVKTIKEDSWVHFDFEDGSNPYIAKTEKEAKRMLKKYKDRVVKIKDGFYTIKKEKEINESENLKEDESENLNEDKYSDSTWYEYDIDGNKFNFLCRSWERSNAWGHEVELKSGYNTISTARVRYYNRTWEMFTYQTCMLKAVDNWIDSLSTGAIDQYKSMNDVSKLKSGQRQEILDADKNYILAKKLYDAVSKGRGLQESEEKEYKDTEVIKHTDKHSIIDHKKLNEEQEDKVEGLNVYQDKFVAKAFKQAVLDGVFREDQVEKVLSMLATDKRLDEEEQETEESILEKVWTAVCSDDRNFVTNAFNKQLIKPNTRYNAFDRKHSLIMGALRNGNYEMADLLKSFGEGILKSEVEEYKEIMSKRNYEDDTTKGALEEKYEPKEEDCIGKAKDVNGTFFDVYEHEGKYFDVLGNELDKDTIEIIK